MNSNTAALSEDALQQRVHHWLDILKNAEERTLLFIENIEKTIRDAVRTDRRVEDLLSSRGTTSNAVIRSAYLTKGRQYFEILDKQNPSPAEGVLFQGFREGDEFSNFEFRRGELEKCIKRAEVQSIFSSPRDTDEAMQAAIAAKLRNIHLSRAKVWYDCLQAAAADGAAVSINPQHALLRLEYHLQQSQRDYSALTDGNESDSVRDRINEMARKVWWKNSHGPLATSPQLTGQKLNPDKKGKCNGIYVFDLETDLKIAEARSQCGNFNSDIVIRKICDGKKATGLSLSELFAESGRTSSELFREIERSLEDRVLENDHGIEPATLGASTRGVVLRKYRIQEQLRKYGISALAP